MKPEKEDAVSPVVGVMLMLVVTIVIAALVSAFAGGLATTTEASPMVTFDVDFSKSTGMVITCTGTSGKILSKGDMSVLVSNVGTTDYFTELPLSYFNNVPERFNPGSTMYINVSNIEKAYTEGAGESSALKGGYITAASAYDVIGDTFTVQIANDKGVVGSATSKIKV
ncbi:MAG: type IV pilin N-terminal domain-containing protein [Methanocorpusculum sp.]|nr:type IV pilin N-terminal domain-containing protein [Methanocorpusculum sp.]